MFARNSDLYFDVSASCSAFSSSALRPVPLPGSCARLPDSGAPTAWPFLRVPDSFAAALLPALQLACERLRLPQQVLGPRIRLDGVDHDADALGQLLEERLVRWAEPLERRELEHALNLPSKITGKTRMLCGVAKPKPTRS
jgi:hypothetical protein